ncbi:MAG: hypothetical protein OXU27_07830 [Candidatus Poribacteria bacterium]|nr:hypothetical protein [Candidatus Poribacteria bacterium]
MKIMRLSVLFSTGLVLIFSNLLNIWAETPTSAKIVFTTTRDGNAEIYVMNTDGSEQVRLTNHPGDDFDPTWSPTGEHIAFVSERDHKGLYDIYLMDADGQNIRRAFDELDYRTAPSWSPDGKKIAYHTYSPVPDWAVYFNAIDGGTAERVTEVGIYPSGFPAWSPDGTEIAFGSVKPRGAPKPGVLIEWHIWTVNLQTRKKEMLPLKIEGGDPRYPAWSPDGRKLAFSWWSRGGKKAGVYTVRRKEKSPKEIVKNASGMLAWSPDGKELLYKKTIGGQKQLFKIDLATRLKTPLALLGPSTRRGRNTGWDWFDPKVLPVSPKPQLLTTVWGEMKIQD